MLQLRQYEKNTMRILKNNHHFLFFINLLIGLRLAALMEAGSVVPSVSLVGRDGEPHVRVREPGGGARGAGGRNSPALRRPALPAGPQAGDAQLWPSGDTTGLQDRRSHRQG